MQGLFATQAQGGQTALDFSNPNFLTSNTSGQNPQLQNVTLNTTSVPVVQGSEYNTMQNLFATGLGVGNLPPPSELLSSPVGQVAQENFNTMQNMFATQSQPQQNFTTSSLNTSTLPPQ